MSDEPSATRKPKAKPSEVEVEPDAWKRFVRAVDKVLMGTSKPTEVPSKTNAA